MRKSILIFLFALLGVLSARAYDFEVGGIYYDIPYSNVKKVEVTYRDYSYNSYSGSVVIPSTVTYDGNTYTVTSIGSYAFYECRGLTSVTIPESVTTIGYGTFRDCSGLTTVYYTGNLVQWCGIDFDWWIDNDWTLFINDIKVKDVLIPDGVTAIGAYAFNRCTGLTSVTIPESVTSIGGGAFEGCTGLTSMTIPESVTSIGSYAFYECRGLTSVTIPESVTTIGNYAFKNCSGLTSVTIPESVTTIGQETFAYCSGLTSVTIPESVTSIGYDAFDDCSNLTAVYYTGNLVQWCGIDFDRWIDNDWTLFINDIKVKDVLIPDGVTAIGAYAFNRCTGLTSVTIPTSVDTIGAYAFNRCTGLTSVTIPTSVNTIGAYAFYGCTSIDIPLYNSSIFAYMPENYIGEYTIPSGILTIAGGAFSDCRRLTSVTIPESVTTIGNYAFEWCSSLTAVTIPDSVTSIGHGAFRNCSGLTSVKWNAIACYNASSSSYSPFTNTSLTSIAFGSKVEHIPAYLCYGMNKLTSVTIPESVTSIGEDAFRDCSGLTAVEWNAVACQDLSNYSPFCKYDDNEHDYINTSLTSIIFGSEVKRIPAYLCSGCRGLTSVTIPESVTTIREGAFSGCSGLTSVEWNARRCSEYIYYNNGVGYYGSPFGDTPLTTITFGEKVASIPHFLCLNIKSLTSVTMGERVTTIGYATFAGCTGLTAVTIGEGVTTIGNYAFDSCTGLTKVTIGESVTVIGEFAFADCSGLTSVTIPDSVTTIGYAAFADCSGLTSVTIGEGVTSIWEEAFYGCDSLTSVVWNAVACRDFSSDNPPFPDGENITSVTFGKQVEHIPAFLCYGLSGLTAITLPGSVDTVGKGAFKECYYLLSVTSLSKTPPYCFYDEENSVFSVYGTLFVPKGSKKAYQTAQEWYKFSRIEETETTYTVTVQPNNANMGTVTGGGKYQEGEQAILAAIPNQGYRFVRWDDGSTNNPRILAVSEDITLTAIFAKKTPDNPDDPDNPDNPTANENSEADNFRVYVQDRTIHLSEDRGLVQVYNMAGQCVYNGHATAIPVQRSGVYVLVTNDRRIKVLVK